MASVQTLSGRQPSAEFEQAIVQAVRERVGRYAYPRQVEFVASLPRGEGGKVQRTRLREREGVSS